MREWSDHGSIAGHSHYLHTIQFLYDKAVYLTNSEYKEKYKETIDVQKFIERPSIWIIARSAASVSASLRFSECRQADFKKLIEPIYTSTGCPIKDILRVSAVDGPERQLKCGQQMGGVYKCPCGIHTSSHQNLIECFRKKSQSQEEKRKSVTKGCLWKRTTVNAPNPLAKATAPEIRKELSMRTLVAPDAMKAEMTTELKQLMHGMLRVPDVVLPTPETSLTDVNCGSYQVTLSEFMHDFTNCLSNFLEEVPLHVKNSKTRKKIEQVTKQAKGDRGIMRGCDARLAAIELSTELQDCEDCVDMQKIAQTFAEMSCIAYSAASERTPTKVLRYHNLSFMLGVLMKKLVPLPQKISHEKYFGSHSMH